MHLLVGRTAGFHELAAGLNPRLHRLNDGSSASLSRPLRSMGPRGIVGSHGAAPFGTDGGRSTLCSVVASPALIFEPWRGRSRAINPNTALTGSGLLDESILWLVLLRSDVTRDAHPVGDELGTARSRCHGVHYSTDLSRGSLYLLLPTHRLRPHSASPSPHFQARITPPNDDS